MPLPKPRKGEKKENFLTRVMQDDVMVREYPDQKQRYAVALSLWEAAKKKAGRAEAIRAFTGTFIAESAGRLRAVLIREGVSKNGNDWTREALQDIARLAPGTPVHFYDFSPEGDGSNANHWAFLRDMLPPRIRDLLPDRLPEAQVGRVSAATVQEGRDGKAEVVAEIEVDGGAGWFRSLLSEVMGRGKTLGLSIHVPAEGCEAAPGENAAIRVTKVRRIVGFDVVHRPSAGGGILELLEALAGDATEGEDMDWKKLLRYVPEKHRPRLESFLREKVLPKGLKTAADLVKEFPEFVSEVYEAAGLAKPSADALADAIDAMVRLPDELVESFLSRAGSADTGTDAAEPKSAGRADAGDDKVTSLLSKVEGLDKTLTDLLAAQARALVAAKVEGAGLPGDLEKFAKAELLRRVEAAGTISEADINGFLAGLKGAIGTSQARDTGKAEGVPGLMGIDMGTDSTDKAIAALDGLLEGVDEVRVGEDTVPAFRSIRQAYQALTGDVMLEGFAFYARKNRRGGLLESGLPRNLEVVQRYLALSPGGGQVLEAVTTSTFPLLLSDRMHKRLAKEWKSQQFLWKLVARPETVSDFKDWRILKMGEYGDLPTVAEGADYQPISGAPSEEEITLRIVKHGGLETITWETIINDDTRKVRQLPRKLARAADRTLFKAVFNLLLDNAAIYDGEALASTAHGNLITTAATAYDAIVTMRRKMVLQKDLNNREAGRVEPSLVLVGPSKYDEYYGVIYSDKKPSLGSGENQNLPNIVRGDFGLALAEILYFEDKDADQVWLVADPAQAEMIAVGFLNGRQNPELLVQDLPRVGSFFDADKITYKVRHIWKEAVVDYRGFQALIPA